MTQRDVVRKPPEGTSWPTLCECLPAVLIVRAPPNQPMIPPGGKFSSRGEGAFSKAARNKVLVFSTFVWSGPEKEVHL